MIAIWVGGNAVIPSIIGPYFDFIEILFGGFDVIVIVFISFIDFVIKKGINQLLILQKLVFIVNKTT